MAPTKAATAPRTAPPKSNTWTFTATDPRGRTVLRETFEAPPDVRCGATTGVGGVLAVLQTASVQEFLREHDALAAARARGLKRQFERLTEEGGVLGVQEVAELLSISRQAVDLRRANGKLLAIDLGARKNLYPRWQFTDEGVLRGLEETLAVLREGRHSAWACLRFVLTGNLRLGGDRPLDLLRRGELAPVLVAAETFDTHGAV